MKCLTLRDMREKIVEDTKRKLNVKKEDYNWIWSYDIHLFQMIALNTFYASDTIELMT